MGQARLSPLWILRDACTRSEPWRAPSSRISSLPAEMGTDRSPGDVSEQGKASGSCGFYTAGEGWRISRVSSLRAMTTDSAGMIEGSAHRGESSAAPASRGMTGWRSDTGVPRSGPLPAPLPSVQVGCSASQKEAQDPIMSLPLLKIEERSLLCRTRILSNAARLARVRKKERHHRCDGILHACLYLSAWGVI